MDPMTMATIASLMLNGYQAFKGNNSQDSVGQYSKIENLTPEQQQLMNSLMPGLQSGSAGGVDFLSKLASGDESMFEQLEAPAMANFQKTLGQIGSRFSHLGAGDSSYMENALSGAGSELAQNLQSQRMGLRNNAVQSLLSQSNQMLNVRPFDYQEPQQGTDWGGMIGKILPALLKLMSSQGGSNNTNVNAIS